MYLLGYDIGSSSVKVALVEADTKKVIDTIQSPKDAMNIEAPKIGLGRTRSGVVVGTCLYSH